MKTCEVDGCDRPHKAKGDCAYHYHKKRYSPKPKEVAVGCLFPTCEREHYSKGLCNGHYYQQQRGKELTPLKVAKKPEGFKIWSGYRLILKHGHPNARTTGHMYEHTWVMSEHLGRPLREGENVHHINGVRDDNRIENLELWSTSQPAGQRVEDKTAWAIEWLKQYAPEKVSA